MVCWVWRTKGTTVDDGMKSEKACDYQYKNFSINIKEPGIIYIVHFNIKKLFTLWMKENIHIVSSNGRNKL